LAEKLGLDHSKVYEVIARHPGNSWKFENRVPHILDNDYSPESALDIFTKDLGTVSTWPEPRPFRCRLRLLRCGCLS
jgi:putative dehydrogenase